jgi:VanZ family protein
VIVRDWLRHPPRLVRWGLVLVWMALIFALSAQPDLPRPVSGWLDLLVSSGAHFLLYGVLALLLRWPLGDGACRPTLAFGLALLYGVSDEFHQSFVPGRVPDILDLVSDGLGAALALAAWRGLRRRRRQHRLG